MATSYLSPGVYVEEVDRGSKPIEAVGTNTVGFLGESAKGPVNEAVLVTNWSQFVKTFGDFTQCSEHLAHARLRLLQQRRLALLRRQRRRARGARPTVEPASRRRQEGRQEADTAPVPGRPAGRDGALHRPRQRSRASARASSASRRSTRSRSSPRPGQTSPAVQDALLSTARRARTASRSSTRPRPSRAASTAAQAARLEVRRVLLPVDPGLRPGQGQRLRAAVGPHRRRLLAHRRASAACTRRPPTRSSAARSA